ncbi:hypothetical protein Mgra_00006518 [Meloidogyne graminicola]|uniref:Methyltransferase-like protein 17, mitochondrial n=1 Tax=Meloidogyne graminicola TaxID=189291 RepID=A0A8S9ZL23_9BILA|nr:hypothetical protein Mgra_00006518 [Meloidogyne graminicola]
MVRQIIPRQLIKMPTKKTFIPSSLSIREVDNSEFYLKRRRRREQDISLNRTFANRCAHLTTINHNTQSVGVVKLTLPPKAIVNPRVTKLSKLPLDAVEALGGILMESKSPPKELQREADKLSNKLDQRLFPPSIVEFRQTRREILDQIFEQNPAFSYDYNIYQNRPFIETQLAKLVQKRLASRRYNWKPLKFKDLRQATIYCLSRFGSHFAEMKRVLAEFDRNGFVPHKILDFGSGIGSSFWAAYERWGDNVQEYSLIDNNLAMRHFSIDLSRGSNYSNLDFILTSGYEFDLEKTKELLYQYKAIDQDTIEMLSDKQLQTYERYCKARELLPDDVKIPTRFDPGHVFAPCPHDKRCPKLIRKEACKFSVRWQEFRADHKTTSEDRDGTLTGTFSYIILEKGERDKEKEEKHPRILKLERGHRCVSCQVCTAFDGLQRFIVGKRTDKVYARIRRAMPSQLLPVEFDLIKKDQNQVPLIATNDLKEEINEEKKLEKLINSSSG